MPRVISSTPVVIAPPPPKPNVQLRGPVTPPESQARPKAAQKEPDRIIIVPKPRPATPPAPVDPADAPIVIRPAPTPISDKVIVIPPRKQEKVNKPILRGAVEPEQNEPIRIQTKVVWKDE